MTVTDGYWPYPSVPIRLRGTTQIEKQKGKEVAQKLAEVLQMDEKKRS